MSDFEGVVDRLSGLVSVLVDDIRLASTRVEHVRLSARANEANAILVELLNLNNKDEGRLSEGSEQEG